MNKDNIIEFSKDDITFYGDTKEEKEKNEMMFDLTMENDRLYQQLDKYKNVIDKIKELINHYAVENEDYSKIYNQEEKDILELLEEVK